MLAALRTMRQAIAVVSKASPRNAGVISTQLRRFTLAQSDFEGAVAQINATR